MYKKIDSTTQSGNVAIVTLVILALVAVGALVYLSGAFDPAPTSQIETPDVSADAATDTETAAGENTESPVELEPGNPVVGRINGEDITRQQVFTFIQTLPPQTRQMPLDQLFPLALEQVINAKLIEDKTENVNLDDDPEVKKQLDLAKKQIEQTVYIQNMINAEMTDERVQQMYDKLVAETPKETEIKAAHILVEDEATAKEVIEKLIETGDFAALAKEYSKDATAEKGGDLGYFLKGDVVKEFGDAAFAMEAGTYTKDPVKTQFGYHIIKIDDKRERQPPTMEQARPFIEANLRRDILEEIVKGWREEAKIERYDVNGKEIGAAEMLDTAPAAPTDASAPAPAEEEAPAETPAP